MKSPLVSAGHNWKRGVAARVAALREDRLRELLEEGRKVIERRKEWAAAAAAVTLEHGHDEATPSVQEETQGVSSSVPSAGGVG